ncbi:MAG: hypothetical protein F2839_02965 [Actinobacteria bacterium]|uniref:Unannotated protein n=1 Tax=freshwater metagenome TaxID=449393 RepID=A0A6J5Z637_9ZZZZ|nr:hypothetical protein [Actinomycetota bacterium]
MKFLYEALVLLHLVGVIAIAYGFFKELRKGTRGINAAMLHGASTQFATGLIMVGLRSSDVFADEEALNMSKIGIKLLVTVIILATVVVGRRATKPQPYWALIGALTLVNIVIATAL